MPGELSSIHLQCLRVCLIVSFALVVRRCLDLYDTPLPAKESRDEQRAQQFWRCCAQAYDEISASDPGASSSSDLDLNNDRSRFVAPSGLTICVASSCDDNNDGKQRDL